MTEISFYHQLHTPLERALPRLMEKVLESVLGADPNRIDQRAEALSGILWTYEQNFSAPWDGG